MKLCIITGSYPPDVCGVGDYTKNLVNALRTEGFEVFVFHRKSWSIFRLYEYMRELHALKADVYLMQYPTEGYGYSIVPQLLMFGLFGKRRLVTLHEYSRKSLKGKFAIFLFFLAGCDFVFTNQLDANFARRWAPWIGCPRIISIGSNIPWNVGRPAEFDLCYFGLIRPHKGIEEFLHEAFKFKQQVPSARLAVMGDVPQGYETYAQEIFRQARGSGFEVKVGLDIQSVGSVLSATKISFFPFADGLSERRGSVLAALGNGCLVVGTGFESDVNPEFQRAVVIANSSLELYRIYEMNESDAFQEIKANALSYCRLRSWARIAAEHDSAFRGTKA